MIIPILELYQLIEKAKPLFEVRNLNGDFFIDLYHGQPLDPELHEYYSLPALFVDSQILGQGTRNPRKVQLTLHLVVNMALNTATISDKSGLQGLLYPVLLQMALEGKPLGNSTGLIFESQTTIESEVTNYYTLVFSFESDLRSLIELPECELGTFETVDLKGQLKQEKV